MFKAWQVFETPALTRHFLDHIAVRLRQQGELCRGTGHEAQKAFVEGLHTDVQRRHKFLLALCATALDRLEAFSYRRAGLFTGSDLEWLLSVAPGGSHPAPGLDAEILCNLIERAFLDDELGHFDVLYAAAERWPALRARYASWFDGIRLDSPEVVQWRAQQEQLRALESTIPPPLAPDLSNQILTRLAQAEAGE
jgi:hypothetical protein